MPVDSVQKQVTAGSRANSGQVAPSTSIVIASDSEAISGRRALDRSRLLRRTSAPRNDSANLVEICSLRVGTRGLVPNHRDGVASPGHPQGAVRGPRYDGVVIA